MDKDTKRLIQKSMNVEQLETVQNMSKADWSRLKDQQEFRTIKKDSAVYKISLANDTARIKNRSTMENLKTHLFNIHNANHLKVKKNLQIQTGVITDTLNGDLMTVEELQLEVKNAEVVAFKERNAILNELFSLAGTVGMTDLLGNVVYSEKEYEKTVSEVEGELDKLGIKLFD